MTPKQASLTLTSVGLGVILGCVGLFAHTGEIIQLLPLIPGIPSTVYWAKIYFK